MRTQITPTAMLIAAAMVFGLNPQSAVAQDRNDRQINDRQAPAPRIEMQREPRGYTRPDRPGGVDKRPTTLDRPAVNHNYNAARAYHIGPYHAPPGWQYTRWQYGQFLPGDYWAQQYWLSEYWLFGLDVPPLGYEWVRYGNDAILINIADGEIVQCVYGLFL